jgi:hypothetical protein
MDPIANFAQVLLQAKAVKPVAGGVAILLGLAAVKLADTLASPLLFWITAVAAATLLMAGAVAILIYIFIGPLSSRVRLSRANQNCHAT